IHPRKRAVRGGVGCVIDLKTVIGSRVGTSIQVGRLIIPAASQADYWSRFAEPCLLYNEGFEPYELSISGSLTLVKIHDRYFAISTQHQLAIQSYNYDQVSLTDKTSQTMTTSHAAFFPEDKNRELDCLIYEFTDVRNEGKLPEHSWFDLTSQFNNRSRIKVMSVYAIGYPGYRNHIDYCKSHYGISPNGIYGEPSDTSISGRHAFKPKHSLDYEPSGMSGGPVFGLSLTPNGVIGFFAGIITDATKSQFHYLGFSRIFLLFDHLLSR
ncbi:MAG: hypothetical protein AAFX51_16100, partial [Cyanobacteria bacterium J06636_28]